MTGDGPVRNVVVGRLRPSSGPQREADLAQLERGLAGIAALDLPGALSVHVGRDLGLRSGGWDFAITNDWTDAAAYRAYDLDPEHNRHRAAIVEVCAEVARVQFPLVAAGPGQEKVTQVVSVSSATT